MQANVEPLAAGKSFQSDGIGEVTADSATEAVVSSSVSANSGDVDPVAPVLANSGDVASAEAAPVCASTEKTAETISSINQSPLLELSSCSIGSDSSSLQESNNPAPELPLLNLSGRVSGEL